MKLPFFGAWAACCSAWPGLVLSLSLAACSSAPKTPDWQLETKGALDRAIAAWLEGNTRVEAVEFARARSEISSTGRVDLMARAELLRCASHVASLVVERCSGFEKLRQDAAPAEQAYADYLLGALPPQQVGLLPVEQRGAASGGEAAIKQMSDPLSKLVAVAVAFQTGRASPALIQLAVDAASAQGWRRPLLAWLAVQAGMAEKAGDQADAARLRRRMELTLNETRALR